MLYRIVIDIDTRSNQSAEGVQKLVDDPATWLPIVRIWTKNGIEVDRIALINHPTGRSVKRLGRAS